MLRHGRLGDSVLGADDGGELARRVLAAGEELQDAPANRVPEDVERVHATDSIGEGLYKSILNP